VEEERERKYTITSNQDFIYNFVHAGVAGLDSMGSVYD